jgi:tetratricopeptide (TPR) repeat protein
VTARRIELYSVAGEFPLPETLLDASGGGFLVPGLPDWLDPDQPVADDAISVGVADTGVLSRHPVIRATLARAKDFTKEGVEDRHGHGTAVALIAIASAPAPVRLFSAKAVGKRRGGERELADALEWLGEQGIQAIILRAGLPNPKCDGRRCRACRVVLRLAESGIPVEMAAGNTPGSVSCPAKAGAHHDRLSVVYPVDPTTGTAWRKVGPHMIEWTEPHESRILEVQPPPAEFQHARRLAAEGRSSEAIAAYRRILTGPQSFLREQAAFNLALLLADDDPEAKELYSVATQSDDERLAASALNNLGGCYYRSGEVESAAECFARAADSADGNQAAMGAYNLAMLRYRTGDRRRAMAAAWRAVEMQHPEWSARALVIVGLCSEDDGELEAAVEAYEGARRSGSTYARELAEQNLRRLGRL